MRYRILEEKHRNIRISFWGVTLVLSTLLGVSLPFGHGCLLDPGEIKIDLPENWRQMSINEKLKILDEGWSKNVPSLLISEIQQFSMRRQVRKLIMDKKDDGIFREGYRYHVSFRFYIGWKELALLAGFGFAFVWIAYGCVQILHLLIPSTPITHFPAQPGGGRVESLYFLAGEKTGYPPCVKITLFSFLVFEERFKKPEKPKAVWVE